MRKTLKMVKGVLVFLFILSFLACTNSIDDQSASEEYSIKYDLDGGKNSRDNPDSFTEEDLPLKLKTPKKEGYHFYAWISDKNEIVTEIPKGTKKNVSVKALWYKDGEAYYLVKHKLQTIEDELKYDFYEQKYLLGVVGEETAAAANTYKGFTEPSIVQKVIAEDFSTVVDVQYNRKTYNVNFVLEFGDRRDHPQFNLLGKYQEKIIIPDSYIPEEYKVYSYTPYEPTYFGDADEYLISLESKYEYNSLTSTESGMPKESFTIPFVCRDFRGYDEEGSGDGFITQEHVNMYGKPFVAGRGHPDFENKNVNSKKIVTEELGPDGIPVFNIKGSEKDTGITKESFDMWYRDVPGINQTFSRALTLKQKKEEPDCYIYESNTFFPIDNEGYGNRSVDIKRNYGFTDDMCFYFRYMGEGSIEIQGDDDIWIFVNGKLAVDLGGCHNPYSDVIKFNAVTKAENFNGEQLLYRYNEAFDIVEGQMVEVRIFHAERHTSSSIFHLHLNGLDVYERKLKE